MNVKFFITLIVLAQLTTVALAQTKYTVNGTGRTIITNDKLTGPILDGDNATPNKGTGGYILFDMGNNLSITNDFSVNATLRMRAPFGAFWGVGTEFSFRQFQINARIKKKIELQLGDINIGGMTAYTVNNFDTEYHRYESDAFKIRRNILEYENFIHGSDWRLQGIHVKGMFDVNSAYVKGVSVYGFVTRTNATNDIDVSDRILSGGRVNLIQSGRFQIGVNYVGMNDMKIDHAEVNYNNNVLTGNTTLSAIENDNLRLEVIGEAGFSNYNYVKDSAKLAVKFNDFMYDAGLKLNHKSSKLVFSLNYRDVGPNFTSPSAQTRRININRTPLLFPSLENKTVARNQTLFDRMTDEKSYTRSLTPLWMQFLPEYNNITPYGRATANRRGINAGISTDTSSKNIDAEVQLDYLTEVIGEGGIDKRNFLGAKGGFRLKVGQLLNMKKRLSATVGGRYENTTRKGAAPIALNSTLLDFGIDVEAFKKVDLIFGLKMLNATGNEYINMRDEFNQIASIRLRNINVVENIYSIGVRLRFLETSFFNVSYNLSQYKDNTTTNYKYDIGQLFVNFTLNF